MLSHASRGQGWPTKESGGRTWHERTNRTHANIQCVILHSACCVQIRATCIPCTTGLFPRRKKWIIHISFQSCIGCMQQQPQVGNNAIIVFPVLCHIRQHLGGQFKSSVYMYAELLLHRLPGFVKILYNTGKHTYMHTYIPTYIRTYIRTYIHNYIHTYPHTCTPT